MNRHVWFAASLPLVLPVVPCAAEVGPGWSVDAVAASHWAKGSITLLADGSGILTRSTDEEAYATDTATVSSGVGQASALYVISLASASISAQASAAMDPADLSANVATAQVNDASFQDKLTFTIPAGAYPLGIQGIARGFVQANVQADAEDGSGVASSDDSIVMSVTPPYGGTASHQAYPSVDTNEASGVNEFFTLPFVLLPPNSVLAAPTTERAFFSGAVVLNGAAQGTLTEISGATRTSFSANVAAAYTRIDVPIGVTWVSESGVFLSQPVPEPAPWALLLAGLGLFGLKWRARERA